MPATSRRDGPFQWARIGSWGVVIACAGLAITFCLRVFWWRDAPAVISYDIYAAHYPILLYARQSLEQGHGLLWNRLQNCGQPFLPSTLTGLLYPLNWLLLWLDLDHGFLWMAMLQMTLTGLGMYALCREMSLGRVASLCAALGWEISAHVLTLAGWQPTSILGVYLWIPFAMWRCERILLQPTALSGIGLGLVLTLQLLPGYPQIQFFTLALLGLRVLWEFLCRPRSISLRLLGAFALGLALPPFLGAAALFPMLEFAQVSLRNTSLTAVEMDPDGLTWEAFRTEQVGPRVWWGTTLSLLQLSLGGLGIAATKSRRLPLFYLLASVIFVALAFENPLSAVYQALPISGTFRYPTRFLWMAGFTLSVLAAFGVEALSRAGDASARRLPLALCGFGLGAAVLYGISPTGLRAWEWAGLFGLAGACLLAFRFERSGLAAWTATLLLLANLWIVNSQQPVVFLHDGSALFRYQDAFAFVRERITLQDRIHQYGKHFDYAMKQKAASIFGVPSVSDYETQTSLRYAGFYVRMLDDQPMTSINQYYFRVNKLPLNPQLFDLAAVRYVLVAKHQDAVHSIYTARFPLVWSGNGVRIFENPGALPRAFYVPQAVVVQEPGQILDLLSSPYWDPRKMVLLEEMPADGFQGSYAGSGRVEILSDRSEQVELAIRASADGFLVISDQDYPGWEARVNGELVPILRGNYAFRAVRVPAGESRVEFQYRPRSVRAGFAVSLATAIGLLGFLPRLHEKGTRRSWPQASQ